MSVSPGQPLILSNHKLDIPPYLGNLKLVVLTFGVKNKMAGVSTSPDTDFAPNFTETGYCFNPISMMHYLDDNVCGHRPAKGCFLLFINPILYGRGTVLSAVLIKCATLAAFVELHGNQTLSPLDLVGC